MTTMKHSETSTADVSYDNGVITADIGAKHESVNPVQYQHLALTVHDHVNLKKVALVLRWSQNKLTGLTDSDNRITWVPACTFSEDGVVITTQQASINFETLQAKVVQLCEDDPGYGHSYYVAVYFERSAGASDRDRIHAVKRGC